MSYEYEEVINLVVKTDKFNVGLNMAEAMFSRAKTNLEKLSIMELRVGGKELKLDLDRAYTNVLKSVDATEKEAIAIKKRALTISGDIARQFRKQDEVEQLASIKKVDAAFEAAEKAKVASQKQRAKALARAELEEARALHRYRMDMDRERAQTQKQQAREVAQFNKLFMPGGSPLPITTTPPKPTQIHASAVLRAGAGAAGMLGMYPAAGALYGTANAMQALGVSTISAGKAFMIFTPAVLGLGAAFAGIKFIEYGAEFSRELARMSTLMLSASATADDFNAAMDRTAQSAFKLSTAFNMDAIDVVKAFKDALSSGIDVSDLERFTTIAATLSASTATSIQDTTNLLTSIKDAYQLTVGEMTHQTDLLFNAINVGKIQIPAYVNGFSRLSDAGASAGVSLEDLHMAIATTTRQGMPANRVMTSMTAWLHGMTDPSDQAKEAMNALGISFGDTAFEGKQLIEVIQEIRDKTGGSASKIAEIFDDERARQFIRSMMQGINLAKTEIIPGMQEVGTNAVAADRAMNNLFDNWQKSVLSVTNAVKASSAETGGWLNQLVYGDKGTEQKEFVDKMERLKKIALSGITRGQTQESIKNAAMSLERPDLFAMSANDRFYSGALVKEEFNTFNTEFAAALNVAYAEAKDQALITIREVNKEFDSSLKGILKTIDALEKHKSPAALSKIENRSLNSRATDGQKQILLDLAEDLEDQKELLAEARKKLEFDIERQQADYRQANIQPIMDEINKANAEGGDRAAIPALHEKLKRAQVEFRAFMEGIDNEVRDKDVLGPFISEINNLTSAIENMRTRIRSQDDRVTREKKEAEEKKKLDAAKKVAKDELDVKKSFAEKVEALYKKDVENYKKAQEERKKVFAKIDDEIMDVAKRNAALQSDIQSDKLASRLAEMSDDPSAQARISRAEKEKALSELQRLAASGVDKDAFGNAVARFRDSAARQRDAGRAIVGDERRAEHNFQRDMDTLMAVSSLFASTFKDKGEAAKAAMGTKDTSVAIRSPQELAKAAASEVKKEQEVMKVIADVQLKLEVDGNLSDKSQNDIANKVVEKVKNMLKNSNPPPSTYDSRTRNQNNAVGITNE